VGVDARGSNNSCNLPLPPVIYPERVRASEQVEKFDPRPTAGETQASGDQAGEICMRKRRAQVFGRTSRTRNCNFQHSKFGEQEKCNTFLNILLKVSKLASRRT
jgi:hypothetical protein